MYFKLYAVLIIYFGLLRPILFYNTKYKALSYGQSFITNNSILLIILLLHNTVLFLVFKSIIFNNIKFSQWLDMNIIFSIILTLLISYSNQQFI